MYQGWGVLRLPVVLAVVRQSVVNGAIVVDESSSREPVPQVLCILAILLLVRGAVRQMRGDRQEQLVRDSVNVDIGYIGINAGVSARSFLGRVLTGSACASLSMLGCDLPNAHKSQSQHPNISAPP